MPRAKDVLFGHAYLIDDKQVFVPRTHGERAISGGFYNYRSGDHIKKGSLNYTYIIDHDLFTVIKGDLDHLGNESALIKAFDTFLAGKNGRGSH